MDPSMDDDLKRFLEEVEAEVREEPRKPKRRREVAEAEADAQRPKLAETLRQAAFKGQLSKVRQLLQGLDVVERLLLVDLADSSDGLTALHLATIGGHVAISEALLSGRADVDARSGQHDTALMWAAHLGHDKLCQLLLSSGADTSLRNAQGQTAAMQAQQKGFRKIKDILDPWDEGWSQLLLIFRLGFPCRKLTKKPAASGPSCCKDLRTRHARPPRQRGSRCRRGTTEGSQPGFNQSGSARGSRTQGGGDVLVNNSCPTRAPTK
eukprot:symbB.v1.2.003056.t1/scaffold161.1/size290820/7